MVKNAFSEGFGMLQSYRTNLKSNPKHKLPAHSGKKAILSETISTQIDNVDLVDFDFSVILSSIGNKLKIHIPLKKHVHFNKLNKKGIRSKSIVLGEDYIQFSFKRITG